MNRNKVQTKKSPLFSLCIVFLLMTLPSALYATDLISVNSAGTASGNRDSFKWPFAVMTPDGRYFFFSSEASDLVTNDTNGNIQDLFVRDMQTGITTLVSVNSAGSGSGNGESFQPSFTPDGRYVVFSSDASDLVPNDINGNHQDIFVRDMQTGTTTLVSINAAGTGSGNEPSTFPRMSTDGRYVAFVSHATDLVVTNDTNGRPDIFVRDLQTGITTLISVNAAGTGSGNQGSEQSWTISPDGRYVAFTSEASDLVNNDTNSFDWDVFVRDLWMGTTTLVSVNAAGTGSGNNTSVHPAISSDGRYLAFMSFASNLVANDNNGTSDMFVRDLQAGTTTLVTVNAAGTASGNGGCVNSPQITPNGRYVVFMSSARDLVTNDINSSMNIFVRDLQTETTTLVSANDTGSGGNNASEIDFSQAISDDGRYVVFSSSADNLVNNDTENDIRDVFVRDLKLGTTTLLSRNTVGTHGNNDSYFPLINANGNYVVFESLASDLVTNDSNGSFQDIYRVALGNEDTASLIAEVEALGAGGSLRQNQVDGLINKLHEIKAKLDNGQTGAACNQLSSFISQVQGFINSGTLTASQGQALIDAANAIKTSIGC